ncbi:MAG TPA: GNAT family N-acetyltransferase [bacterium]|nr:GNAT family N-acetyltransferase [bacterium]HOL48529.1 GNAT family N-acetyltransferase [bacterium]HPQ19695.1 GNAT family N-acetyltransferase [bacterium]
MIKKVKIEINKKDINFNEIFLLYKKANWWYKEDGLKKINKIKYIKKIFEGSFCYAIASYNNQIIGFARVISDGIADAYIQDVFVLPEFQNKKIGINLLLTLLKYLIKKKIYWISLIAQPGAENFYKKLNFIEMKKFIPMQLNIKHYLKKSRVNKSKEK